MLEALVGIAEKSLFIHSTLSTVEGSLAWVVVPSLVAAPSFVVAVLGAGLDFLGLEKNRSLQVRLLVLVVVAFVVASSFVVDTVAASFVVGSALPCVGCVHSLVQLLACRFVVLPSEVAVEALPLLVERLCFLE